MAYEITCRENLLIVTPEADKLKEFISTNLPQKVLSNITYAECATNDTWARDHGFITLVSEQGCHLLISSSMDGERSFPQNSTMQSIKSYSTKKLVNGSYEDHLDFVLKEAVL